MSKIVELNPIMSKARKHYASSPTGYAAGIVDPGKPNATITVTHIKSGVGRGFSVGDTATYDSYNLIYTGEIVKITEKAVTIRPRFEKTRTKRLDLEAFAWRNYKFDEAETARRNAETSMYI